MNVFQKFDEALFFFINHRLHFAALDKLMPFYRSQFLWLPLYVFFISYLFLNFGKRTWIYLLALGLTVGVADQTSSRLIKNTVERLRPCNDERLRNDVKLLVPCGSGYSFTSSHATNHFAAAVFVILTFVNSWKTHRRVGRFLLIFWAASISFGQIYVGVHFKKYCR